MFTSTRLKTLTDYMQRRTSNKNHVLILNIDRVKSNAEADAHELSAVHYKLCVARSVQKKSDA